MRRTGRWFCVLASIPYVVLAVALVDWLNIPSGVLLAEPQLALASVAVAIGNTIELLWPVLVAQLAIAAVAATLPPERGRGMPVVGAVTALSGVIALTSYLVLAGYVAFEGEPLLIGAWVALWIALSATYSVALLDRRFRRALAGACLVIAIGAAVVNVTQFPAQYPTLHAALWMVTASLGHAGATALLATRPLPRRWVWRIAPATLVGAIAVAGVILAPGSRALAYARAYTGAGQYELFTGDRPPPDRCIEAVEPFDAERAFAVFAEHSQLPALPEDFRLDDHNLLFVMIDATRFDDTSFGNQDTTPRLAAFAERHGAYVFARAYSSSARTTTTVGSMFDMTYPSHARMTSLMPPWIATLSEDIDTPAELFSRAGYETFRFTHQFPKKYLTPSVFQGFERNEELPVRTADLKRVADPTIADLTVAELQRLASTGDRFFGWVFFIGPHHPYLGLEPRAETHRGLYRQDIQRADEHIGRVFETLEETGLIDDTVIVFMSDHGEEFGEHGVFAHGMSLFDTGTRVPLVVWVPGMPGGVIDEPTSVNYVWPWLAARSSGAIGELAESRIREHYAPMMEATRGAVPIELNDWERLQTALVWPEMRLIYDFYSELHFAYDVAADPGETTDIAPADPDSLAPYLEMLARYRAIRACQRRVVITTDTAERRPGI